MITLAPGVTFEKEAHKYHYKGVQLSGITCRVGPAAGYGRMTGTVKHILSEAAAEGNHVHEAIEDWINSNLQAWNTIHPAAVFVRDKLLEHGNLELQAETLVSDFKQYASAIDILSRVDDSTIDIYDIKRSFSREYVTWQLSVYKYLVETYSDLKVRKMCVFATKDRRFFDDIKYKGTDKVEELLYGSEKDNNKIPDSVKKAASTKDKRKKTSRN